MKIKFLSPKLACAIIFVLGLSNLSAQLPQLSLSLRNNPTVPTAGTSQKIVINSDIAATTDLRVNFTVPENFHNNFSTLPDQEGFMTLPAGATNAHFILRGGGSSTINTVAGYVRVADGIGYTISTNLPSSQIMMTKLATDNESRLLTWDADVSATSYRLRVLDGGVWDSDIDVGINTYAAISGIDATFTIDVVAVESPASSTWTGSFSWDTEPGATGYNLMYGTSPGSYSVTNDVGLVLSTTVAGLDRNLTYYAAVEAYDGVGSSPPSIEDSHNAAASESTNSVTGFTIWQ